MSAMSMAMAAATPNREAEWPEKLIRPIRNMHPLPKMKRISTAC
jgi:hypothetical protein